jgi:hypothetical protein
VQTQQVFVQKKIVSGGEMRPIERTVMKLIGEKGITMDDVLELLDRTSRQEMKKSFPDDCHFQKDTYFAKIILQSLVRYRLVKKEGNRYVKTEAKKDQA